MKTIYSLLCAAAFTASAQTVPGGGIVYQQAGVITAQTRFAGTNPLPSLASPSGAAAMFGNPEDIAGLPFSATQQSHSVQVLGDGTRIELTETQQLYRDGMGRTRVETRTSGSARIMIDDPVAGFNVILYPATKTARKTSATTFDMRRILQSRAVADKVKTLAANQVTATIDAVGAGGPVVLAPGGMESGSTMPTVEDLPAQNINGVLATGRRTTLTIPTGEIGNDRPIVVTSETWYSSDLHMVVKSSNSDPRFGDTSLELTNIGRSEPDPSLFQIPAEYTVSEPKTMHSTPMAPR